MYYPDQRFVSRLTTVQRECLLPFDAIGNIQAHEGKKVDIRDVVAHGAIQERHVIIDAARILGLKKRESLEHMMLVEVGTAVDEQTPIAGKDADRGKRVFSPVHGIVTHIDDGRIIMQVMPEIINLEAGVQGTVVEVYPGRGVAIEATGGLIQGVWGNSRDLIATLRMEPKNGLETALEDSLDMTYKGAVVAMNKPLTVHHLIVATEQNIGGIIAPSMDSSLRDRVMQSDFAVMLTEGFGHIQMNSEVYLILKEYEGYQVSLDAYMPERWEPRRPEVIVNRVVEERPPAMSPMIPLRRGMRVRVTSDPHLGQSGKVADLPGDPILLDNGLRVRCAQVELITGLTVYIPLTNLELAGR